ncbi:hypothetical protein AB4144_55700, partial [Rhizobiaceae sp. 2RAB30]
FEHAKGAPRALKYQLRAEAVAPRARPGIGAMRRRSAGTARTKISGRAFQATGVWLNTPLLLQCCGNLDHEIKQKLPLTGTQISALLHRAMQLYIYTILFLKIGNSAPAKYKAHGN